MVLCVLDKNIYHQAAHLVKAYLCNTHHRCERNYLTACDDNVSPRYVCLNDQV